MRQLNVRYARLLASRPKHSRSRRTAAQRALGLSPGQARAQTPADRSVGGRRGHSRGQVAMDTYAEPADCPAVEPGIAVTTGEALRPLTYPSFGAVHDAPGVIADLTQNR